MQPYTSLHLGTCLCITRADSAFFQRCFQFGIAAGNRASLAAEKTFCVRSPLSTQQHLHLLSEQQRQHLSPLAKKQPQEQQLQQQQQSHLPQQHQQQQQHLSQQQLLQQQQQRDHWHNCGSCTVALWGSRCTHCWVTTAQVSAAKKKENGREWAGSECSEVRTVSCEVSTAVRRFLILTTATVSSNAAACCGTIAICSSAASSIGIAACTSRLYSSITTSCKPSRSCSGHSYNGREVAGSSGSAASSVYKSAGRSSSGSTSAGKCSIEYPRLRCSECMGCSGSSSGGGSSTSDGRGSSSSSVGGGSSSTGNNCRSEERPRRTVAGFGIWESGSRRSSSSSWVERNETAARDTEGAGGRRRRKSSSSNSRKGITTILQENGRSCNDRLGTSTAKRETVATPLELHTSRKSSRSGRERRPPKTAAANRCQEGTREGKGTGEEKRAGEGDFSAGGREREKMPLSRRKRVKEQTTLPSASPPPSSPTVFSLMGSFSSVSSFSSSSPFSPTSVTSSPSSFALSPSLLLPFSSVTLSSNSSFSSRFVCLSSASSSSSSFSPSLSASTSSFSFSSPPPPVVPASSSSLSSSSVLSSSALSASFSSLPFPCSSPRPPPLPSKSSPQPFPCPPPTSRSSTPSPSFFLKKTPSPSKSRGSCRGYLFDPIADAAETEPQTVARLDELAMVQLKTVRLPADLRQRLQQLLQLAGRKKDIEKIGRYLMAKYTARTSVELPRVLPSQLFAGHCASARGPLRTHAGTTAAREEEEGDGTEGGRGGGQEEAAREAGETSGKREAAGIMKAMPGALRTAAELPRRRGTTSDLPPAVPAGAAAGGKAATEIAKTAAGEGGTAAAGIAARRRIPSRILEERSREEGGDEAGISLPSEALLQQEALALAEDRRHRLFRKTAGSYSPLTAAAYTAHRYAGVYSSLLRILHEVKVRAPDFIPRRVLEMQAGFAAGLAAAARVWGSPSSSREAESGSCSSFCFNQPTSAYKKTQRGSFGGGEDRYASGSVQEGEERDAACAAWWDAATGASSRSKTDSSYLPRTEDAGRSSGGSSYEEMILQQREENCRRRQEEEKKKRKEREEKQKKSGFEFLLAVERSPHLASVGKFLTADLHPPVEWQLGLYEEGLGSSCNEEEEEEEEEGGDAAACARASAEREAKRERGGRKKGGGEEPPAAIAEENEAAYLAAAACRPVLSCKGAAEPPFTPADPTTHSHTAVHSQRFSSPPSSCSSSSSSSSSSSYSPSSYPSSSYSSTSPPSCSLSSSSSTTSSISSTSHSLFPSASPVAGLPPSRRRRFDLILLPHSLLLFPTTTAAAAADLESGQQQVRLLWNRLRRGGVLLLLERGTPTGFRVLHAIREMFIRELGVGKFHFIAPCPHESICPLALTGRDWCHFGQRVERLPHHVYCKGSRAKNVEEEKFSFLAVRKMPGPRHIYQCESDCKNMEERSYFWPRLVMPVIKAGQHCLLDVCAAPHAFERVAVSKSMPHTAGYKNARKAAWGDLWRFPRRIIRPEARGYTDEEIRSHMLRLRRKVEGRRKLEDEVGKEGRGKIAVCGGGRGGGRGRRSGRGGNEEGSGVSDELEAALAASFGG